MLISDGTDTAWQSVWHGTEPEDEGCIWYMTATYHRVGRLYM